MGKLYYWAEGLDDYSSDNELPEYDKIIEIKRLSLFIGKNNAGKSKLLRCLFQTQQEFRWSQNINLLIFLKKTDFMLKKSNPYFRETTEIKDLLEKIQEVRIKKDYGNLTHLFYNINKNLKNFSSTRTEYTQLINNKLIHSIEIELEKNKTNLCNKKYYIPTLRGMRPFFRPSENKQPYIARNQDDYFKDKDKYNSKNIITGECLYYELTTHLLGEPIQRELIKNYEMALSQYFFNNDPVTLIPKHNSDVVFIKIGNDQQLPIFELGDGLQQAIILTYEAFIKKDEAHAFFIEEPELHMHPGMLRQLMNFYLNETPHYYFFTTHSNHLLDMVDESDEVIIQKFTKKPDGKFQINRCDKDRDLLAALGVKPSSVYLANCTIWVEGITDRLYITRYMEKYLESLKVSYEKPHSGRSEDENREANLYEKYRRLMPNYHYAFVEYAGSNLTHWDFDDEELCGETLDSKRKLRLKKLLEDDGLIAKNVASNILLIADGDIEHKGSRTEKLDDQLDKNFYMLKCKETENTLPTKLIVLAAKIILEGLDSVKNEIKNETYERVKAHNHYRGKNKRASLNYNIDNLVNEIDFYDQENKIGIGKILDTKLELPDQKTCFSDDSGTIKNKTAFCRLMLILMEEEDWVLNKPAKELCNEIFDFIDKKNGAHENTN